MRKKIKILFLAANPVDAKSRLRLDEEFREIEAKISQGELRKRIKLVSEWAVRPGDLQRLLLKHRPDILHFSGHGSKDQEITLEDQNGNSKGVKSPALTELLSIVKDNLRIVMLNACYSEDQAKRLSETIDCTIGMNSTIGDLAAIVFSAHFYQSLAFNRSVKDAFRLAINELGLEDIEGRDIPKLLIRNGLDASNLFIFDQTRDTTNVENGCKQPDVPPLERKRRSAAFFSCLLASLAVSLIADIGGRFLGSGDDWPDLAGAIAQPFILTIAALAAVFTGTSIIRPAGALAEKAARILLFRKALQGRAGLTVTGIALAAAMVLRLSLPAFAHSINERGLSDYYKGDLTSARGAYRRALRLKPSSAEAHYNLAATYEDTQPDEAIKEYLLAIDCDGKLYPAYNNLARLWIRRQMYDQALGLLEKAVESSPTDPRLSYSLYKNLGWVNYALKRYAQAEPFLRQAASIKDYDGGAAAHCLLALVLKAQNRTGVEQECEDCVRFAPGEEDVEADWLSQAKEHILKEAAK